MAGGTIYRVHLGTPRLQLVQERRQGTGKPRALTDGDVDKDAEGTFDV